MSALTELLKGLVGEVRSFRAIVSEVKAQVGPVPEHQWKGTRLRFQNPDGWGEFVDLIGPQGKVGKGGAPGAVVIHGDGGSATDAATTQVQFPADTPIGGHRAVRISAGKVIYSDAADVAGANLVLGLTTGATDANAQVVIQTSGPMTEESWSWTPDLPVFCGADGVLTQTPPASGFSLIVGIATGATQIFIGPKAPIVLQE